MIPILSKSKSSNSVNMEKSETVLSPQGILSQVTGKTHATGGENVDLENDSLMFSEKILLPKQIVAAILGKKVSEVKKMSPAELSKKFPTENYIDLLKEAKDNAQTHTRQFKSAELMLGKNITQLKTIFDFQQKFKKDRGVQEGKLLSEQGLDRDLNPVEPTEEVNQEVNQVAKHYKLDPRTSLNALIYPQLENDGKDKKIVVIKPDGTKVLVDSDFHYGEKFPQSMVATENPNIWNAYYGTKKTIENIWSPANDKFQKNPDGTPIHPENYTNQKGRWLSKPDLNAEVKGIYSSQLAYNNGAYDNTPEAKRQRKALTFNSNTNETYKKSYIPTVIDTKTGKPIARLRPENNYYKGIDRNIPYMSLTKEQQDKYLEDSNIDIQYWATDKIRDPNNKYNGYVDLANLPNHDDTNRRAEIRRLQDLEEPFRTNSQPELPRLPQYVPKIVSNKPPVLPSPFLPKETTPPDEMRLRVPEELDNAKYGEIFRYMTRDKGVPYLANDNKAVAYNRYIPINTLSQERAQEQMNNTLNSSNATTQMSQGINADSYAKTLEGIDKVNLENYQADLQNDNNNNRLYMDAYNFNQQARNKNMEEFVGKTQIVEDQFDKEGERMMDNIKNYSLQKAEIQDDISRNRYTQMMLNNKYLPYMHQRGNKYYTGLDNNTKFAINEKMQGAVLGGQEYGNIELELTKAIGSGDYDKAIKIAEIIKKIRTK